MTFGYGNLIQRDEKPQLAICLNLSLAPELMVGSSRIAGARKLNVFRFSFARPLTAVFVLHSKE